MYTFHCEKRGSECHQSQGFYVAVKIFMFFFLFKAKTMKATFEMQEDEHKYFSIHFFS